MASATVEVEDKDGGKAMHALMKDFEFIQGHHLKVGVVVDNSENLDVDANSLMWDDEKNPQETLTIGQNARDHHPLRPWLTLGVDKYLLNIETHIAKTIDEMIEGKTTGRKVLMSVGRFTRAWQRLILDTEQVKPVSQARVEEKRLIGNPRNALINWGRMRRATSFRIDRGD